MIRTLWNRFGTHLMFVGLVGLIFLGAALLSGYGKLWFPPRVPSSATLDMTRIITYERALKADVLNVIFDEEGYEWVWVLWDIAWLENDPIAPFVEQNDPISVVVIAPNNAIVEVDGEQYAGSYYRAVWIIACRDTECTQEAVSTVISNPDILNWDWGRH